MHNNQREKEHYWYMKRKSKNIILEIIENRGLIKNLAKNDFKTKFAGSYLGIVWAFIQPIVTVLVYWFVFQVGLRAGDMGQVPFVLYLIAGIIPWFYFQDALSSGTNALIEYSYLVKKVVFKISILPMVKLLSALFVHGFFVLFAVVLFSCYGYYPDLLLYAEYVRVRAGHLLCHQRGGDLLSGSVPDHHDRAAGGRLDGADHVGPEHPPGQISLDLQVKSYVLHRVRVQGCILPESLVLAAF